MTQDVEQSNKTIEMNLALPDRMSEIDIEQLKKLAHKYDGRIKELEMLSTKAQIEKESLKMHVKDLLGHMNLFKDYMLNYIDAKTYRYGWEVEPKFHRERLINLLNLILQELEEHRIVNKD